MKKSILFLFIALSASFFSCDRNDEIYYPPIGNHGDNLLYIDSNTTVDRDENYSFRVDLQEDSRLKIKITDISNYSGPAASAPKWVYSGENGWEIGDFQDQIQEFKAVRKADLADMAIQFKNSPGKAIIDFYENSRKVTKTITITW